MGACPATVGGHVRWPGGGGAAAGGLPGWLRPDACAAAGLAAVTAEVRGCGDLYGAGAARGRVEGVRGGGRLRLPVPGRRGQWWGVPASTAGSWLSRFAARAGWLRAGLLGLLPLADPQARPVAAAGSAAGDALAALEAVTAGLRRRFGGLDKLAAHEVAAHLTGGMLLAPPLPALAGNTTLIAMAAVTPS